MTSQVTFPTSRVRDLLSRLILRILRVTLWNKLGEFSFGPLGFVPLGFGSLNHGIWPLIRLFGTQNLGVQTLRVQI